MSTSEASSSEHQGKKFYPTFFSDPFTHVAGKLHLLPSAIYLQAQKPWRIFSISIQNFADFRAGIAACAPCK